MKKESIKTIRECISQLIGHTSTNHLADKLTELLKNEDDPIQTDPLPLDIKPLVKEVKNIMLTFAANYEPNKIYTEDVNGGDGMASELTIYFGMANGFTRGYDYLSLEFKGITLNIYKHSVSIDAETVDLIPQAPAIIKEMIQAFKSLHT